MIRSLCPAHRPAGNPRAAQAWSEGPWSAGGPGTCSAVVAAYAELVQAPAVLDRELVIVGEGGLLAVAHVHAQLVAALGRDPVYVVQPCGDEQRMQEPGTAAWEMGPWPLKYILGRRRGIGNSDPQEDGLLSDRPSRTPTRPLRRASQVCGGVLAPVSSWSDLVSEEPGASASRPCPCTSHSNLVWLTVAGGLRLWHE